MAEEDEIKTAHEHEERHEHHDESDEQNDAAPETADTEPGAHESAGSDDETPVVSSKHGRFGRIGSWLGAHKVWASVGIIVVVLAIVAAAPWTRFKVAGLFLKQTVTVTVLDSQTGAPVTSATVTDGKVHATTDNHGQAHLHVAAGSAKLSVTKAYYQTTTLHTTVPVLKPKHGLSVKLTATGRQVPITVINKLNGRAVENAVVSAAGSETKTDAKGQAVIVLPADKTSVPATVTATGFNGNTVTVQVTVATVAVNDFSLTPSGKLYFLSNLSGKIDVVKTNLDGTDRQTVLAGTGKEDTQNTVLLATRDWKYLALLSKRDGGDNAKLFLIDTSTDKLTTMDEGNANFGVTGWDGHSFVYTVSRTNVQDWQPNQQALKSFNADTGTLATIDQTAGTGSNSNDYQHEQFSGVYVLDGAVVYVKNWTAANYASLVGKQITLNSAKPDGSAKKVVQNFAITPTTSSNVQTIPYEANGLYLEQYGNPTSSFYTYEDGTVKPNTTLTDQTFFDSPYATYLQSPSGTQTFWTEQRDGKNTLFVGNADGDNGKQVATLSNYTVYGWYTDNYLLVSKNSSELYVMSLDGSKVLKVSDYYKPAQNFNGYGSGYGGL